jgi:hypothetical protein
MSGVQYASSSKISRLSLRRPEDVPDDSPRSWITGKEALMKVLMSKTPDCRPHF